MKILSIRQDQRGLLVDTEPCSDDIVEKAENALSQLSGITEARRWQRAGWDNCSGYGEPEPCDNDSWLIEGDIETHIDEIRKIFEEARIMIYQLGQDALIYHVRQDYIIRVTEPSGAVHISAMANGLNNLLRFIEDGLQGNCTVEIQAVFYPPSATPKEALVALNEVGS